MGWLIDQLDPRGRTVRAAYWLTNGAALLAALFLITSPIARPAIVTPVGGAINIVVLLLTIRRLRDAGRSPWIVLWFFFPMEINCDLATISFHSYSLHLIDFGAVLKSLPVLIGLFAPSAAARSPRLVTSPAF
ncbi:MAG TPA: DUF805 domain-containing protein [Sphingomonas sp.]